MLQIKSLEFAKSLPKGMEATYYNQYRENYWYDWFAPTKTLGGKLKRIVLPILHLIPNTYNDHEVWVKESIPMWCNGYVYNIFLNKPGNDFGHIRISYAPSENCYSLYVYDTMEGNENDILYKVDRIGRKKLREELKNLKA